jgi:hypothetical protein
VKPFENDYPFKAMVKLKKYRFTLGVHSKLGKEHQLNNPAVREGRAID